MRKIRFVDPGKNYQMIKTFAKEIRVATLRMTHDARSSHIGSCLSIADLLAVLYNGIMNVDPKNPEFSDRDRFILSKGHAAAAIYATLAKRGFFPEEVLDTFYKDGSILGGHATYGIPGIEASTGSLGHGLSIGCGMAMAAKIDKKGYRTFVLLGDGECDEGSIWEAALFAPQWELDNLIAVIDYNKIQSFGRTEEVLNLEPFSDKWRSFGWSVIEIDGHDYSQIENALSNIPRVKGKPSCIIANTIKGKGVSFMENSLAWHYLPPNDEQLKQAINELGVME